MEKERIDVLCVEKGIFDSREKAKRAIINGIISVNNIIVNKPGTKVSIDSYISIIGNKMPYVSRGGLKLEKALDYFHLDIKGLTMLDIGSSTGGFSDCALQRGIAKVYALDVGTNQLVDKIRNDPKVVVMENTNFRYVNNDMFDSILDFATIDVSFISLKYIFPVLSQIIKNQGDIIALIKPQFEAGKDEIGKNGIVKEKKIHKKVIHDVIEYGKDNHLYLQNLTYSPITGGEGNIEFLALFKQGSYNKNIDIDTIVDNAHNYFESR